MMPFHERVASSSCSLEPRFIDFAAKQIELLVGEPEDAFAVDDRVACVEGIAAFAGGEKLRLRERDGLFRILSLTESEFLYLRSPANVQECSVLTAAARKGEIRLSFPSGAFSLTEGVTLSEALLSEGTVGFFRLPPDTDPENVLVSPENSPSE